MFFRKCMVCSGFPYSCLLLRLCNAYAEIGLLVLIHLIGSRRLISISLPVWPTYDLLHVLHCNICMPLEFILFSGILSHNWLYVVLHVLNVTFKSVFFNKLVTLCVRGLKYVNVIHFFSCVCVLSVLCVLSFRLFAKLWMICNGKPLFLAMVQIMFHSCCLPL